MTDTISINPATGERVRWHVRRADTGGRLTRAELWCAPGGGAPHRHVHPNSEERFELLAGRLAIELEGRRFTAAPGDAVRLPAGVPHAWRVEGDEEAHFFVELDDPRAFEEQIETFFALGRHGRLGTGGRVPLLLAATLALDFLDTIHLASPPLPVQRALFRVLTGVARLTGHHRAAVAAREEARARLSASALVAA